MGPRTISCARGYYFSKALNWYKCLKLAKIATLSVNILYVIAANVSQLNMFVTQFLQFWHFLSCYHHFPSSRQLGYYLGKSYVINGEEKIF